VWVGGGGRGGVCVRLNCDCTCTCALCCCAVAVWAVHSGGAARGLSQTMGAPLTKTSAGATMHFGASFASTPAPAPGVTELRSAELVLLVMPTPSHGGAASAAVGPDSVVAARLKAIGRRLAGDGSDGGAGGGGAGAAAGPAGGGGAGSGSDVGAAPAAARINGSSPPQSAPSDGQSLPRKAPAAGPGAGSMSATVRRAVQAKPTAVAVPHWSDVRTRVLGQSDVMMQLMRNFRRLVQAGSVPAANFENAKAFLLMPPFTSPPTNVARQRVIVALMTWAKSAISYFTAFVRFDLRKERVARMKVALEGAEQVLGEAEARYAVAATEHEARTRRHGESCMLLEECSQRAVTLQARLEQGTRLVTALQADGVRWMGSLLALRRQCLASVGDSLVAAASLEFGGTMSPAVRAHSLNELWVPYLRGWECPLTEDALLPPLLSLLTCEPERLRWMQWSGSGTTAQHENLARLLHSRRVPLMIDPVGTGSDAVACLAHTCGARLVRVGGEAVCDPGPTPPQGARHPHDGSPPDRGHRHLGAVAGGGGDPVGLAWMWGPLPSVEPVSVLSPKAGEIIGSGGSLRPVAGTRSGGGGGGGRGGARPTRPRAGAGASAGSSDAGAGKAASSDVLSQALDGYLRASDALTLASVEGEGVPSPRALSRPRGRGPRAPSLEPTALRGQDGAGAGGSPSPRPQSRGKVGLEDSDAVSMPVLPPGASTAIADVIVWLARTARRRKLEALGRKTLLSWTARQRYKRSLAGLLMPLVRRTSATEEVRRDGGGGAEGRGWGCVRTGVGVRRDGGAEGRGRGRGKA
jgi:hypothetical protein